MTVQIRDTGALAETVGNTRTAISHPDGATGRRVAFRSTRIHEPATTIDPLPRWKRYMDVAGASLALAMAAPLMLGIGLAIKCTSRGPVIFRQTRAGVKGRPFTCLKFRTMIADAEAQKQYLLRYNERSGVAFKMSDDPRTTRVGRVLRKLSLDELPQLINVLKGEMSLVGPRPLPVEEAIQQDEWQRARMDVAPGLTCLWQVYARHTNSFDTWARLDLEYVRRRSPMLDLKLLLLTIPAVISTKGAY